MPGDILRDPQRFQAHLPTAISLRNIGVLHHKRMALTQATEFLEKSLGILLILIVRTRNSLHPLITAVLDNLAGVYEDQGRRDEALAIQERNEQITETSERSCGAEMEYDGFERSQ